MERYLLKTLLMSDEDLRVMMEALWHAVQRGDIPDDDRARAHKLRAQFKEKFEVEGE